VTASALRLPRLLPLLLGLGAALPTALSAQPDYDPAAHGFSYPTSAESYGTSLTAFPASTRGRIDGYPLASRLIAATGRTIYLHRLFGGSEWFAIGELNPSGPAMDPSFVAI
jgi:hypothetical protein